ncbi:MAG: molybdenum cofactor guanylyltransferase [Deltaproteobacteria bacterium]|nr:molybdenum cofactor guanylyltransferase [Deltaproteobacteria bacterium]MBW2128770.1 molybdenum cofactor guanylyltransferase [Deltaproteobacteria bacterium]
MSDLETRKGQKSPSPHSVTGVILAGGKSLRYGRNKALVEIKGVRLIDRVVGVMSGIFHKLLIVTNTPEEYAYLHIPMVEDLIKGLGPLGGLYTGLKTISDEAGFFVACDMPFINSSLIRHMIETGKEFDAVVPRVDWKIEPLHALYHKTCLPLIEKAIEEGRYQIIRFFDEIRVRYVREEEIRRFDPHLLTLININKPEELTRAARLAR